MASSTSTKHELQQHPLEQHNAAIEISAAQVKDAASAWSSWLLRGLWLIGREEHRTS
jgi:hypothetical protein